MTLGTTIGRAWTISRREALVGAVAGVAASATGGLLGTSASATAASLDAEGEDIVPFRVAVPQEDIDDLKRRLLTTRFPDASTEPGWIQGVPLAKAKEIVAYWATRYDWRRFERRLNALPQFKTPIDGLDIHFIHVKSKHAKAMPIILTHGWPGSVVEFMDVIEPLTDPSRFGGRPEDAFHVVVPSMPGFAWSDKPSGTGWNVDRTAKAWAELMRRLGYDRWVAQGGDWGSGVTHALGRAKPAGLVAAHVNWPFVFPAKPPAAPDSAEQAAFAAAGRFSDDQSGYYKLQATRPQTIGYALADSPSGQAMWIYEKLQAWSDNRGSVEDVIALDAILDNISVYWFTDCAASSARIYRENATHSYDGGRIDLPMAATVFPKEIYRAPRKWAEQHWSNLYYWNEVDRGGHFAAFEQPELFASEMRKAFRPQRR